MLALSLVGTRLFLEKKFTDREDLLPAPVRKNIKLLWDHLWMPSIPLSDWLSLTALLTNKIHQFALASEKLLTFQPPHMICVLSRSSQSSLICWWPNNLVTSSQYKLQTTGLRGSSNMQVSEPTAFPCLLRTRTAPPNLTPSPGAASLGFSSTLFFPQVRDRVLPGWPPGRRVTLVATSIRIRGLIA